MAESVHVDRALIEENLETKALAPARNKPSYYAKGDELNPVWQKQKSDD